MSITRESKADSGSRGHLDINGLRLVGRRFGVGRYVEYLLREWSRLDPLAWPFASTTLFTPEAISDPVEIPAFIEHRVVQTNLPKSLWEQCVLPFHRRRGSLLFCPSYVVPLASPGKTVVTHLGSYEALPNAFSLRRRATSRLLFEASARRADFVITVSESSRTDIMKYYRLPSKKIAVIPLGVDERFRPLTNLREQDNIRQQYFEGRPFFLFVGKLTRRRNIPQLIQAVARVREACGTYHGLLLVGENSLEYDLETLAQGAGIADSVVHLPYADHEVLPTLYNAADIFVYPSSYEGFGIPLLEAMACGTPGIVVKGSAFSEFGDGAHFAADGSSEAICAAMVDVLSSREFREELSRKGRSRARDFGWGPIAKRTLDVLVDVATSTAPRAK